MNYAGFDMGIYRMRKAQKRQTEVLAGQLNHAQEALMNVLEVNDYASVISLLEQCQQSAIQLGDIIEHAEGEGFVTISLLEEYCEQIYRIYEAVASDREEAVPEMKSILQKLMADIRQSIAQDIKVHFEIVFLPFKASAWDTMKQFWKAAMEDPAYDVYVIPVPYYYKTWNGNSLEMCWEGEHFPDEIPITRYDEFDFEKHCPDVIMIHNPYDKYNPVTSVHPFFYSDNLKKYTEKLVYTPWFYLDEITREDQAALENMNCFIAMPGVVNADKVIVQSETMRCTYINYLTEKAGENTRELWENKICAFNLPGTESFWNERRKNIPAEWSDRIVKPDGNRKKLILCSVNISSLIQHGEKILQKLRETFAVFQEYKEEIMLFWYSQPLTEKNLKTLRPYLWDQYDKLAGEFLEKNWGIFDNSEQKNETAELCDAYYGSGDTVTCIFYRNNKPVWLIDSELDERAAVQRLTGKKQNNGC